jgi:hypothetical protein
LAGPKRKKDHLGVRFRVRNKARVRIRVWYFGILLGSPLAVAKAADTLPGVQHNT